MHKLTNAVKYAALILAAFIAMHWLTAGHSDMRSIDQSRDQGTLSTLDTPHKGTPQYVLDQHRTQCWVGTETPKAELPGAAIVQFNDGRTIYTKKHVLVDAAFNEALALSGADTPKSSKLDVVALCR